MKEKIHPNYGKCIVRCDRFYEEGYSRGSLL